MQPGNLMFFYNGTPITGWDRIDDDGRTVQVVTDGVQVCRRHKLGSIWLPDT